MCGLYLNLLIY